MDTAEHLGMQWCSIVKFCETRFAQSELKVYINFEKNYATYCRTWGRDADKEDEGATENQLQGQSNTSIGRAANACAGASTCATTSATTSISAGVTSCASAGAAAASPAGEGC